MPVSVLGHRAFCATPVAKLVATPTATVPVAATTRAVVRLYQGLSAGVLVARCRAPAHFGRRAGKSPPGVDYDVDVCGDSLWKAVSLRKVALPGVITS
jgi:hypothetical protein